MTTEAKKNELVAKALKECLATYPGGLRRRYTEKEAREVLDDYLAGDCWKDYALRRLRHILAAEVKAGRVS